MQEELTAKVVALDIKSAKLTASVLNVAIRHYLNGNKSGKQTIGSLMKKNEGLSSIEITDDNIRSFERVAKKYHVDFSAKKDKLADPPRYVVFFKAKDVDVITAAFKEYTTHVLNKSKKPSVREKLNKAAEKSREMFRGKTKEREREKSRAHGQVL